MKGSNQKRTRTLKKFQPKKNLISDTTVFKIQQYYSISVNAVIYRLVELDFVDNTYYDKYIGYYGIIANELFKSKKISESFYLELMNAINIDPFAASDNGKK